jgi:hypothetical protein
MSAKEWAPTDGCPRPAIGGQQTCLTVRCSAERPGGVRAHQRLRVGQGPREHGDGFRRAPIAESDAYIAGEPRPAGPPHGGAERERTPRRFVECRLEQRDQRCTGVPGCSVPPDPVNVYVPAPAPVRQSPAHVSTRRLRPVPRAHLLGGVPAHWIRDSAADRAANAALRISGVATPGDGHRNDFEFSRP